MRVQATRHGDTVVFGFESGDVLDSYVAADVKAQAFRALEARTDVVLDLSTLEFVDSAGLGVVVAIYKRVTGRGRRIVVAAAQPYVVRVMKMLKLDRVFESFPDVATALEALSRSEPAGAGQTGTQR